MNDARVVSTDAFVPMVDAAPAPGIEAQSQWPPAPALRVGMWLAIAAITMLFLAFTSAYVVRHGIDPQWQAIRMPRLLPANTVFLLISSICLQMARRDLRPRPWLVATLGAGLLFVAGQLAAWSQLGGSGMTFASSSHASFFYTLTALHGLHVAGGLAALGWITCVPGSRDRWLGPTALYWHFMGALWVYLVFLLFGVR